MMTRQARPSAKINGFDTHMILEAVPARHSGHKNGHQAINRTSRHYAGALPKALPAQDMNNWPISAPNSLPGNHLRPVHTRPLYAWLTLSDRLTQ
jgi:hypothetical protein